MVRRRQDDPIDTGDMGRFLPSLNWASIVAKMENFGFRSLAG